MREEIIELSNINPSRISNIYLYGSRVYNTCAINSDYDILIVGNNLLETQEIYAVSPSKKYNIHIHVPNKFENDLKMYNMNALECIWAPEFAKIQIKKDYSVGFELDKVVFKKRVLSQSFDSWIGARRKFKESDIYRGCKSVFHSLRILIFGIQILTSGKIINFSEANGFYNSIMSEDNYNWIFYKDKYLPIKKELERILIKL